MSNRTLALLMVLLGALGWALLVWSALGVRLGAFNHIIAHLRVAVAGVVPLALSQGWVLLFSLQARVVHRRFSGRPLGGVAAMAGAFGVALAISTFWSGLRAYSHHLPGTFHRFQAVASLSLLAVILVWETRELSRVTEEGCAESTPGDGMGVEPA